MRVRFEKIEEILEDYGLGKLIEEVENDQILDKEKTWQYCRYIL